MNDAEKAVEAFRRAYVFNINQADYRKAYNNPSYPASIGVLLAAKFTWINSAYFDEPPVEIPEPEDVRDTGFTGIGNNEWFDDAGLWDS